MFALPAVLALVLVVVIGIVLVETLNPMPAAKGWAKAAYRTTTLAAPSVPSEMSRLMAERAAMYAAFDASVRLSAERYAEALHEADRAAAKRQEEHELFMDRMEALYHGHNTICDTVDAENSYYAACEEQQAEIDAWYEAEAEFGSTWTAAEQYAADFAQRTRRAKAQHTKCASPATHSHSTKHCNAHKGSLRLSVIRY